MRSVVTRVHAAPCGRSLWLVCAPVTNFVEYSFTVMLVSVAVGQMSIAYGVVFAIFRSGFGNDTVASRP